MNESDFKNTLEALILLATASTIALGILLWQLISVNFLGKISFYGGFLAIVGLDSITIALYFVARHYLNKKSFQIVFWSLGIFWIFIGPLFSTYYLSEYFDVPNFLFFIAYYFLVFFIQTCIMIFILKKQIKHRNPD